MKSRTILCAIAAVTMGMSSLSFAQGAGYDRDNNRAGQSQRDNDRGRGDDNRRDNDHRRDNDNRRDHDNRNNHDGRHDNGRHGSNMGHRGYDQTHYGARGPEWHRGGYVPTQYRSRQYVVNDWRGHHLHAPPRGQQWVQVGGDYVLMAIATGVIVQLMLTQ